MGRQKDYLLRTERGLNMNLTMMKNMKCWWNQEPAPYPDIPAKAPGMLTEHEEEFGVIDVVQEEMEQTDKEQAILAAENSGLDFSSMSTKVIGGEVIEILDNEEEEAIHEFVREEILMKLEPDQEEEVLQDAVKTNKGDKPRRLAQA